MMFITHLLFSLLVGLFLIKSELLLVSGKISGVIVLMVVMFGGLFPDIDHPDSKLGKRMRLLSRPLSLLFGHRGFTHTIFFGGIVCAIVWLFSPLFAYAFLAGFLSHLVMDGLTREGVALLIPFSKFRIRGIFMTSGIGEMLIGVILAIGLVYFVV